MKKSLIALAFGTLGLGIAEFVMMGILPDVAKNLHISIATAGHLISAYALGVCVGAPMLILARKFPLKRILMGLVAIVMIGNICASLAPNYWVMLVARFISGLPHGAYFGVASIVAEKLADKGKGSEAVSIMIDCGNDYCKFVWSSLGDVFERVDILAVDFPFGRSMECYYYVLYLAVGSSSRELAGYGVEGTISFS